MRAESSSLWKGALSAGLIGGGVCVFISLVGMVETFGERFLIIGVVTMGEVLMLVPMAVFAYFAARSTEGMPWYRRLASGGLVGLTGGAMLALLALVSSLVNVRAMFVNASPALIQIIYFGQPPALGSAVVILVSCLVGLAGGAVLLLPPRLRRSVILAIFWVGLLGLLRDLIVTVMIPWGKAALLFRWMFASKGLTVFASIVLLIAIGGATYVRSRPRQTAQAGLLASTTTRGRLMVFGGVIVLILLLPIVLGIFFSEILANTGIYVLMGLGLNIVVGFAGLLDLGYVAFFAIGAYTLAVLTSPELGFFHLTYFEALPFCVLASVTAGVILGLPVLKMRGDYLAIVTLGFGEIIRLLVLSDWLRPWLGGAQGVQHIAVPVVGPFALDSQGRLFYLIVIAIGIAAFIAIRLKDSRLGRAWMAVREDEDVAQAMGINVVTTKLLAFACGAFFAGLSGTLFAAKLTSAYPTSFNLLVSINALSLIIVGGMGSIPGVVLGSLALVGSPDLLREFAEFRYLAYGALLIIMMLVRPEGLWPEARRRLELHEEEALVEQAAARDLAVTD
jgi:branched-chain amino acid transport system permease protein